MYTSLFNDFKLVRLTPGGFFHIYSELKYLPEEPIDSYPNTVKPSHHVKVKISIVTRFCFLFEKTATMDLAAVSSRL